MDNGDYVVVKSGRSGASFLRRTVKEATAWGEHHVMSMAIWQDALLRNGTTVLSTADRAAWQDVTFVGLAEYGMWMRKAVLGDVMKVTNNIVNKLGYIHISLAAYSDLRRRYLPWWDKASEQEGWNMVPPAPILWVRSGDPNPDETKLYMKMLRERAWESTIPNSQKEFTALGTRVDPKGDLVKMARAKAGNR